MGGGGGGFFHPGTKPSDLAKAVRDAQDNTDKKQFDTEVAKVIGSLLAACNDRDTDAVNAHLQGIKKALNKEIDGAVETCFGGSVGKHTYVDGLSDVDALVLLNGSELEDTMPQEVKDYFLARLREHLPGTDIEPGTLAVTVTFNDAVIQLLPAVRAGSGFKIPDANGTDWAAIDPKGFTDALTEANSAVNGNLVPTIKLAKSIVSGFPEDQQLTGYHVELLAVRVFRDYDGAKTMKAMLDHFFEQAPNHILHRIQDPTGQSRCVDEYLGAKDSPERRAIANRMSWVRKRMENADRAGDIEKWKEILTP